MSDKSIVTELIERIDELEQQNKKLMESQKQKSIIKLCNRLVELEKQNKELREALIKCRGCEYFKTNNCRGCDYAYLTGGKR